MSSTKEDSVVTDEDNVKNENLNTPDGGYGWVCVAACFAINGFTWGLTAVSNLRRVRINNRLTQISSLIAFTYRITSIMIPFRGRNRWILPLLAARTSQRPC